MSLGRPVKMPQGGDNTQGRRWRIAAIVVGIGFGVLTIVFLLLIAFGWGLLRGTVERRLFAATGRDVRIAAIRRVGPLSLTPLLELGEVRVAQPDWAPRGDMLRLRIARIRLPVLPLLWGDVRPEAVSLDGVRLALVRDAQGRANWERGQEAPSGTPPLRLGHMTLSDGVVELDDARLDRHARIAITIDRAGLRAAGTGSIAGHPATLRLAGPSVAEQRMWPFEAEVRSALVSAHLRGRAAAPLDFGHFTGAVEADGRDLHDLDRLIDAGLPVTQPFHLRAMLAHDRPAWTLTHMTGGIGRSDVSGSLAVHKHDDRTLIDGDLASDGLDFDDLTNDEGLAEGRAELRRLGPRFFHSTPIHLERLRKTDGTLRVTIRRLLFKTPSWLKSVRATLTLDHGVLTVSPLVAGLEHGRISGSAVVRHQSGAPLLTVDLTLTGARLEGLVTDPATATGAFSARMRLQGHGTTVREAIGRADGTIGVVARDGRINRRAALAIGTDVGRAFFSDKQETTPLRCLIGRFVVHGGKAQPSPLLLETDVARGDGEGVVDLADERLAMLLRGRPKLKGGLRYDMPIAIDGTIERPFIHPRPTKLNAGGVFKAIGNALVGGDAPAPVGDLDCSGLAARVLR